jgi:hypothetical protein
MMLILISMHTWTFIPKAAMVAVTVMWMMVPTLALRLITLPIGYFSRGR